MGSKRSFSSGKPTFTLLGSKPLLLRASRNEGKYSSSLKKEMRLPSSILTVSNQFIKSSLCVLEYLWLIFHYRFAVRRRAAPVPRKAASVRRAACFTARTNSGGLTGAASPPQPRIQRWISARLERVKRSSSPPDFKGRNCWEGCHFLSRM